MVAEKVYWYDKIKQKKPYSVKRRRGRITLHYGNRPLSKEFSSREEALDIALFGNLAFQKGNIDMFRDITEDKRVIVFLDTEKNKLKAITIHKDRAYEYVQKHLEDKLFLIL